VLHCVDIPYMCICECAYVQLIRRELKNRELEDGKDFYNLLRMKDLLKCYWGESERAPHRRVCCGFSLNV